MLDMVIEVEGLRKSYEAVEAVRGIDLTARRGEVLGLLGPNGAGKTTTVEILEGIRQRSAGSVRVLDIDPGQEAARLKERIGICLQATSLPEKITVLEALRLFAAFYQQKADIKQLLDRLQLQEKKDALYNTLSGGQKQRVAIALALINQPEIIFFDEPTTGLDPQVRQEIHKLIAELRDSRRTIVLTTHYIEEAERLCDRVAIVDEGRVVATGSPLEIQQKVMGATRVELRTTQPLPGDPPASAGLSDWTLEEKGHLLKASCEKPARSLAELIRWIDACGLELADIQLRRPTLEDAFLQLTGKALRD
jgi:ABC-2 type transport system ATP-binding protein